MIIKFFSERLYLLRKSKNLTQLKLAGMLGVTQGTIHKLEYGLRHPSLEACIQIADIFDVSLDYLLGRTENPVFHHPAEVDDLQKAI